MQRENWGSKFGFIMAAAGSAVGLGNIWRFPYLTSENGGGAFVFVYLLCVLFIAAPMLLNEIALGRLSNKNPVGAVRATGGNIFWQGSAFLSVLVSFFVMSYYGVIAGWTVGYIYTSFTSTNIQFEEFIANPALSIFLFFIFMLMTWVIVVKGISKGIEQASKVLMPLLFLLLILMVIRSITLPGSYAGIVYFLSPDVSKISGTVVLMAIGQAFFSMAIGWGIMVTYGSYLPKSQNIVSSAVWVGIMDLGVALLAGFMIFPAVFSFGKSPAQGTTLVFQVLPEIFASFPVGGAFFGGFFFILLCVAALTSAISIVEVPVAWLMDEFQFKRKNASLLIVGLIVVFGIPSALSSGGLAFFTEMKVTLFGNSLTGFFDIIDFIFGTFIIVLAGLMLCLYSVWIYSPRLVINEIGIASPWFIRPIVRNISPASIWLFFMRYVCPLFIVIVLLDIIGLI